MGNNASGVGPRTLRRVTRFPELLKPGQIGALHLRNRIVMCPMGDSLANPDGTVSERQRRYFEARAEGGAALLLVGSVSVAYPRGSYASWQTSAARASDIAGLTSLVEVVHRHGARIAAQLVHDGGNSLFDIEQGHPLLVPSLPARSRPDRISMMVTPDEITAMTAPFTAPSAHMGIQVASDVDLSEVIEQFATAAQHCVAAGFDAIELHGGHGYLLDGFRSGYSNQRDDEWGGDLTGRSRMMRETISAVRARIGRTVPMWMRINAFEVGRPGGATLDETVELAPMLVAAGLDALHVSAYASNDIATGVTDSHTPHTPGALVPAAAAVKAVVDVPIITFGRLEPEAAEAALASGAADFVAMGRKLLADPALPRKLAAGTVDDIRPCIYQYRCIGNIFVRESVACVANPETAREAELAIPAAARPRRVLVVGGGPAGMEAARRLAVSGHTVTLSERNPHLGGRLALAGRADPVLASFVDWLAAGVERSGVELCLGHEIDPGQASEFDEVVVATGGTWAYGSLGDDVDARVLRVDDLEPWLYGREILVGPVVFLGGGKPALTLAALACTQGADVVVIEPSGVFGVELGLPGRFRLVHDVEAAGATLLVGAWRGLDATGVIVDEGEATRSVPAATIIVAHGATPGSDLAASLIASGTSVHSIGDCRSFGRVEGAMLDAAELAVALAR